MSKEINRLFSNIHGSYDLMNHVLSMGMDRKWRTEIAKEAMLPASRYGLLDLATGTGALAIRIGEMAERNSKEIKINGVDFNRDMLKLAKKKVSKGNLGIDFSIGDALSLKFPENSFEVITCSFAMRDFDSLEKFVKECNRVLKKGGKVILADMSRPEEGFMKDFFKFYSKVMVLEGSFINKDAYKFLVESINRFDKKKLGRLLRKKGFTKIKFRTLPSGAAFIATAYKE